MDDGSQISLTKQCKFSVNTIFALWMTGLPCSGKTTIAKNLEKYIINLCILDGDELREWLSPKDFSREARNEHNIKVAHLAKLLLKHKIPVCVALISPFKENRDSARQIINDSRKDSFVDVYIKSSLEICEQRDVKGLYSKAKKNEIKSFTGISDPYEAPVNPTLIIDTENSNIIQCIEQIISYLIKQNYIMPFDSAK